MSSSAMGQQEESGEERAFTGLLSDDSLLRVMRGLSTRELLTSLALVCRRWHRLCNSFGVYELVPWQLSSSTRPWGNMQREKELCALVVTHASTIERVHLHGLKQIQSIVLVTLCQKLPRLQELSITCPALAGADLELIFNQLPTQLVSLGLHLMDTGTYQYNRLHNIFSITDGVLRAIYQRCPRIQKLNLDKGIHVNGQGSCNISQHGLNGLLVACPSLTSLDLHSNSLGWPEVAQVFLSCKSLCHFSIMAVLLVQAPNTSDAISLGGIMPKNLTSIRLYTSDYRSVPMELCPVLGMLRTCGNQLQYLYGQGLFNASWQTISVWCSNLKLLDLTHSTQDLILTEVEEVVLCGLFRLLKKLEHIALPAATDTILSQLGQFCPNLREIRLQLLGTKPFNRLNQPVTDRGVIAVAEGCPALRVLCLGRCFKVTISSARAIAFNCRQLKVLVLNGCIDFKDDAVAALLPRLSTSLVFLDLVGCKITHATIQAILQYSQVTTLRVITIGKTLWVQSQSEIALIKRSNPWLKIKIKSEIVWYGFYHGKLMENF